MSAQDVTAVTGKPLAHYEPYVEMLAHVLANGLALATDRDFLMSLDTTKPLHESVREAARESIRWRFAFDIDEIEGREYTAHEDIAELPEGTILRDEIGRVFIRTDSTTYHWRTIWGPGHDLSDDQAMTYTPVRVLYRPEVKA